MRTLYGIVGGILSIGGLVANVILIICAIGPFNQSVNWPVFGVYGSLLSFTAGLLLIRSGEKEPK